MIKRILVASGFILSLFLLYACTVVTHINTQTDISLSDSLPLDPRLIEGKLDNGLQYFIKVNHKPEKRAELRLVINAGSILEDDDQRGLAHLLEHMAFNGTEDFPKQDLVNYLESIGMRFGPDLNAYTGFDETVYMLQVPTDSSDQFDKAFQILENWAFKFSLEDEEIDKERGVIIEEWRLGQGAGQRMLNKQLPIIFKGSLYAERLPIGKMDIIEHADYETIRRFYYDWYRPDLMAVIAVGDFDPRIVEDRIKTLFNNIPTKENPRERTTFDVPGHSETLYAIASDPEATRSSVSVMYKHPAAINTTAGEYRKNIIEGLYNTMLNARFSEIAQQADAPFLYAYSTKMSWARASEMALLGSGVADGNILQGLEAILVEAERVKQFGFTPSELERAKKEALRNIEQVFEERDKQESRTLASELVRHFLEQEPVPGIDYEFNLYKQFIPGITLEEVNDLAHELITAENRVVVVNSPEKEGLPVPSEPELAQVFRSIPDHIIEAYQDKVTDEPLLSETPQPGSIKSEGHIEELDVYEMVLSNGVRVILKSTDFQNDEILFTAFSPGGTSLVPDENLLSANHATGIVSTSGLGTFDAIALEKKLAGQTVVVHPYIHALFEGMSGSASPQDMETLFQLIYLNFTGVREDKDAVTAYMNRLRSRLENKSLSPDAAFRDTLSVTLNQYHPRRKPMTLGQVDLINMDQALQIYTDRFADAGDFTFLFVGNFSRDQLLPYILKYLGGLPSINRNESWLDEGIHYPQGRISKQVYKGSEPKSTTRIVFSGSFDWTRQNRYDIYSMMNVLNIRLREVLREDMSGVYGVGVWPSMQKYPRESYTLNITFGCAPDRVDELTEAVMTEIQRLRTEIPDDSYIQKVRETQRREREVNLQKNRYWLNSLAVYYRENRDLADFMRFEELIAALNGESVRDAARKYFNPENRVQVTLYPENITE